MNAVNALKLVLGHKDLHIFRQLFCTIFPIKSIDDKTSDDFLLTCDIHVLGKKIIMMIASVLLHFFHSSPHYSSTFCLSSTLPFFHLSLLLSLLPSFLPSLHPSFSFFLSYFILFLFVCFLACFLPSHCPSSTLS